MARQISKLYFTEYIWAPSDAILVDTNETEYDVIAVPAGWRVLSVDARVMVANHASTVVKIGDDADDDGWMAAGGVTEETTGMYYGNGAFHAADRLGKLYTADDTIHIKYTGHASAVSGAKLVVVATMYRVF